MASPDNDSKGGCSLFLLFVLFLFSLLMIKLVSLIVQQAT